MNYIKRLFCSVSLELPRLRIYYILKSTSNFCFERDEVIDRFHEFWKKEHIPDDRFLLAYSKSFASKCKLKVTNRNLEIFFLLFCVSVCEWLYVETTNNKMRKRKTICTCLSYRTFNIRVYQQQTTFRSPWLYLLPRCRIHIYVHNGMISK